MVWLKWNHPNAFVKVLGYFIPKRIQAETIDHTQLARAVLNAARPTSRTNVIDHEDEAGS